VAGGIGINSKNNDTEDLVVEEPHHPPTTYQAQQEDHEAISAVAEHIARVVAVGDAKDDGSAESDKECGAEVRELQGQDHGFFPIAM